MLLVNIFAKFHRRVNTLVAVMRDWCWLQPQFYLNSPVFYSINIIFFMQKSESYWNLIFLVKINFVNLTLKFYEIFLFVWTWNEKWIIFIDRGKLIQATMMTERSINQKKLRTNPQSAVLYFQRGVVINDVLVGFI